MRFIFLMLISVLAQAAPIHSDFETTKGWKFPNQPEEGTQPVAVSVLSLVDGQNPKGFTEMLPYILRSPDQDDAGSCLYMSLTGIAEWWLARLNPTVSRASDGPLDLSERYLMNVAGVDEDHNGIENWKTDSIYLFNKFGGSVRNVDYRFTKGWYTKDNQGEYVPSPKNATGAEYSTSYNWIDERTKIPQVPVVKLPTFRREVLFADPESNQWNTGIAPSNIAEQIKTALLTKKAPVHVIYNHMGYWHATVIVGFDDSVDNKNCKFVNQFFTYMPQHATELRKEAATATDPKEQQRLIKAAEKTEMVFHKAKSAYDREGCNGKGIFYVRDSIYGDLRGPMYHYDLSNPQGDAPYVKTTVLLEQDWVKYLANHVTQILVD